MKIIFTPRFRRSYKRLVLKNLTIQHVVKERLFLFENNPFDERLKNHALRGKLFGYRAIFIGYDLRALYKKDGTVFVFYDIGTHDTLYK